MVYCIISGQRIYQKALLYWLCQYLNCLYQHLSFLNIFFNGFWKCGVTRHCLYLDSLTLNYVFKIHTIKKQRGTRNLKKWKKWVNLTFRICTRPILVLKYTEGNFKNKVSRDIFCGNAWKFSNCCKWAIFNLGRICWSEMLKIH